MKKSALISPLVLVNDSSFGKNKWDDQEQKKSEHFFDLLKKCVQRDSQENVEENKKVIKKKVLEEKAKKQNKGKGVESLGNFLSLLGPLLIEKDEENPSKDLSTLHEMVDFKDSFQTLFDDDCEKFCHNNFILLLKRNLENVKSPNSIGNKTLGNEIMFPQNIVANAIKYITFKPDIGALYRPEIIFGVFLHRVFGKIIKSDELELIYNTGKELLKENASNATKNRRTGGYLATGIEDLREISGESSEMSEVTDACPSLKSSDESFDDDDSSTVFSDDESYFDDYNGEIEEDEDNDRNFQYCDNFSKKYCCLLDGCEIVSLLKSIFFDDEDEKNLELTDRLLKTIDEEYIGDLENVRNLRFELKLLFIFIMMVSNGVSFKFFSQMRYSSINHSSSQNAFHFNIEGTDILSDCPFSCLFWIIGMCADQFILSDNDHGKRSAYLDLIFEKGKDGNLFGLSYENATYLKNLDGKTLSSRLRSISLFLVKFFRNIDNPDEKDMSSSCSDRRISAFEILQLTHFVRCADNTNTAMLAKLKGYRKGGGRKLSALFFNRSKESFDDKSIKSIHAIRFDNKYKKEFTRKNTKTTETSSSSKSTRKKKKPIFNFPYYKSFVVDKFETYNVNEGEIKKKVDKNLEKTVDNLSKVGSLVVMPLSSLLYVSRYNENAKDSVKSNDSKPTATNTMTTSSSSSSSITTTKENKHMKPKKKIEVVTRVENKKINNTPHPPPQKKMTPKKKISTNTTTTISPSSPKKKIVASPKKKKKHSNAPEKRKVSQSSTKKISTNTVTTTSPSSPKKKIVTSPKKKKKHSKASDKRKAQSSSTKKKPEKPKEKKREHKKQKCHLGTEDIKAIHAVLDQQVNTMFKNYEEKLKTTIKSALDEFHKKNNERIVDDIRDSIQKERNMETKKMEKFFGTLNGKNRKQRRKRDRADRYKPNDKFSPNVRDFSSSLDVHDLDTDESEYKHNDEDSDMSSSVDDSGHDSDFELESSKKEMVDDDSSDSSDRSKLKKIVSLSSSSEDDDEDTIFDEETAKHRKTISDLKIKKESIIELTQEDLKKIWHEDDDEDGQSEKKKKGKSEKERESICKKIFCDGCIMKEHCIKRSRNSKKRKIKKFRSIVGNESNGYVYPYDQNAIEDLHQELVEDNTHFNKSKKQLTEEFVHIREMLTSMKSASDEMRKFHDVRKKLDALGISVSESFRFKAEIYICQCCSKLKNMQLHEIHDVYKKYHGGVAIDSDDDESHYMLETIQQKSILFSKILPKIPKGLFDPLTNICADCGFGFHGEETNNFYDFLSLNINKKLFSSDKLAEMVDSTDPKLPKIDKLVYYKIPIRPKNVFGPFCSKGCKKSFEESTKELKESLVLKNNNNN